MKRLRIEHQTAFAYQGDVSASYNEARMLPGSTDSQFVLSASLDIEPSTSVNQYVDYFGTRVTTFDILSPHAALTLTARALVEVRPRPVESSDLTWDQLRREAARSVEVVEQLSQTARTAPHPDVAEIARSIAAQHDRPGAAAQAIAAVIGDAVEYTHGVTGVHSTGAEAWEARKGVCQDIAHIVLGALREVGIPARYVSGYLHPHPAPEVGVPVEGESHAWVEWFAGSWEGSTPPTTSRSATGTCWSAAAATTPTFRPCEACTPARSRATCP